MKKIWVLFLIISFFSSYGQGNVKRISFEYDTAGNQTRRYICVNCSARIAQDSTKTQKTKLNNEIVDKTDINKQIKYYPNPVLEELIITWDRDEDKFISNIELYSMSGQLIKTYSDTKDKDTNSVSFLNLPQGFYNVLVVFNTGERKTLKIVKQ